MNKPKFIFAIKLLAAANFSMAIANVMIGMPLWMPIALCSSGLAVWLCARKLQKIT